MKDCADQAAAPASGMTMDDYRRQIGEYVRTKLLHREPSVGNAAKAIGDMLEQAVAEAVAAKDAELMALQGQLGHKEADIEELRAELAALRVPVQPVTADQRWETFYREWTTGPNLGDSRKAFEKAIAEAVAAERSASDIGVQTKIDAVQADAKRERDRHAAELAKAHDALRSLACWLGAGGYNSETVDPELFERKIRDGIDSMIRIETERAKGPRISDSEEMALLRRANAEQHAELAAADQRWQERMRKVEASCQARINKWEAMNRTLNEAAAKSQEKAVAAAYEEAAKLVENGRFLSNESPAAKWAEQLAGLIRQLAAKPQEAGPAGWTQGEPEVGEPRTVAHDIASCLAPPSDKTVAPSHVLWRGRTIWLEPVISGWKSFTVDATGRME